MTTTTIKAKLRAAILTGVVGLLPNVARADGAGAPRGAETTEGVPDHAAAEARGAGDTFNSSIGTTSVVRDHAAAEARDVGNATRASEETTSIVPDHAAAERRSTDGK